MLPSVNFDHAVWGGLRRVTGFVALGILLLFGAAKMAFGGSKLSYDLQQMKGSKEVDVLVQFARIPTDADLTGIPANQIKRRFKHVRAVHLRLPLTQVRALANNPLVTYISPNRSLVGMLDVTTQTVGANIAWQMGYDGTGVGVAVIDSGISQHDDLMTADGLQSRVVYSQSFVTGMNGADGYGHGTHVAGIIGGNGADSTGPGFTRTLKGVAPNVNLINFQVLDQNGAGSDSNVVAAIDAAISLKDTYNIRVINLSLGRPVYESYTLDPICQAAEAAWNAGIVVVAAATNYGRNPAGGIPTYGTIGAPGNDPYVITVGATNTHGSYNLIGDTIASFSSDGPTAIDHLVKPDLVAPGNGIVSLMAPNNTLSVTEPNTLVANSYYQSGNPSGTSTKYFCLSGTSMATPVVSGAAALLIQKTPSLTPDQVKARLMKTAYKTFPQYTSALSSAAQMLYSNMSDLFTVGAGQLNIAAALNNTDLVTAPAISPVAVMNPMTNQVSIQFAQNTVYSSTITWGGTVAWGNNALWGFNLVWGPGVMAGQGLTGFPNPWAGSGAPWAQARNIVWGTSFNPAGGALEPSSVGDGDQ
jgi:serine protease AprX